jgi:hypothetical protein
MTPSRKKPGVAFWATVVVVVALVAYPLSWGPAICVCETCGEPKWMVAAMDVYLPMVWTVRRWGKTPIFKPYIAYTDWWIKLSAE